MAFREWLKRKGIHQSTQNEQEDTDGPCWLKKSRPLRGQGRAYITSSTTFEPRRRSADNFAIITKMVTVMILHFANGNQQSNFQHLLRDEILCGCMRFLSRGNHPARVLITVNGTYKRVSSSERVNGTPHIWTSVNRLFHLLNHNPPRISQLLSSWALCTVCKI